MYKAVQNNQNEFEFYQNLGEDKEYRNEFIHNIIEAIENGEYSSKDDVLLALASDSRFANSANEQDYSKILRSYQFYENNKNQSDVKVKSYHFPKGGFSNILLLTITTLLFGILCTGYIFIQIIK